MSIPLPVSDQAPYNEKYWIHLKERLTKLAKNPTEEALKDTILFYLNKTKLVNGDYVIEPVKEIPDVKELKILSNTLQLEEVGGLFAE